MKKSIKYILIITLLQIAFCINSYGQTANNNQAVRNNRTQIQQTRQTNNKQNTDNTFDTKAINYLNSIGLSPTAPENRNRINQIKEIISIQARNQENENKITRLTDKDVGNILLNLINKQRLKSRFGINTDSKFMSSFPDKKAIKSFDKKFKSSNLTIFDLNTNKNCIKGEQQSLANTFKEIPIALKPIAIQIPQNGYTNKLILINMFGENIGTLTTQNPNPGKEKSIKYTIQLSDNYRKYNTNSNKTVNIKTGACDPNIIKVWKKQFSSCMICGFIVEANKIFFSLADSIYSFIADKLLILLSIFLGLWFVYQMGSNYINMGTDGKINYKDFLINKTIKAKFIPVIIFITVLMIPPSIFVKWTVEPIMLLGITISKEIIKSGDISDINISYTERKDIQKLQPSNDENEEESNKIILPPTETILNTRGIESSQNPNHHILKTDMQKESEENIKSYSRNIIYAIYDVKELISNHIIIGKILSELAIKEIIFKVENLLLPVVVSGAIMIGPFTIIIGYATGIFNKLITKIFPILLDSIKEKISYANILFLGGFIFLSLIILNYILIFYFIEIVIKFGLLVIQIPFLCIAYIFGKNNISSIIDEAKSIAINFISISLIAVFIIMFIEYSYYNILEITPEIIQETFKKGNINILTSHIQGIIEQDKSAFNLIFIDVILIIITIFYISKNMRAFISNIGGDMGDTGFGEKVRDYVKTMIEKITGTSR